MSLRNVANKTIRRSEMLDVLYYEDGNTSDIIKVILETDRDHSNDTLEFAKSVASRFNSIYEIAEELFFFIKQNVRYKEDGDKRQDIKTPAALWKSKVGDCKSFSVFIGTVLKNIGIDYRYRFTSYDKGSRKVTHVYVITQDENGEEIIIDAVWHSFDEEKPYAHKKDKKPLTRIAKIVGPSSNSIGGTFDNAKDSFKQIAQNCKAAGVGTDAHLDCLIRQLEAFHNFIETDLRSRLVQKERNRLHAWADTYVMREMTPRANWKDVILEFLAKVIGFIFPRKVEQAYREAVKDNALYFVYLFTKTEQRNYYPEIQKKYNIQKKYAKIVMEEMGFTEVEFMDLARQGIVEQTGMMPESYLLQKAYEGIQQEQEDGIGEIALAIIGLVTVLLGFLGIVMEGRNSKKGEEYRRQQLRDDMLLSILASGDFRTRDCRALLALGADMGDPQYVECAKLASGGGLSPDIDIDHLTTNNGGGNGGGDEEAVCDTFLDSYFGACAPQIWNMPWWQPVGLGLAGLALALSLNEEEEN